MFVPCPRCQQQNYPNATQCAYCGTPLSPSMIGSAGPGPQQPPQGFGGTGAPGFAAGSTGPGAAGETPMTSASQPQVGQLIDRKYRVERILGEGGMGVVYVALDINADQRVVIKSIRPEFANRGDFRERTLSEGKALAKIDHQNVVRFNSIINSVETNELYIVMQFIDGESLDRTLEKANAAGQKLPITEVIRVFKQILDGVGAAHKEGLMHRDLKPANVLVRAKDGVAKVMDFGISKAEGATKGPTQAGGIVGSLWYMAPEQIKGARDLDKRLDVYALGVVLYELITGVVPFDGETEYDIMTKHMNEPVPSVRTLRPDAPPWIDDVIARATQKERTARFQSCEEFRAMIDQFDGGIVVPRSMTSYENSIVPDGSSHRSSGGGGTASMSPVPGISQGGISGHGYSAPPAKKGGSGAIIGVVVALLLVGGGVGAYFAFFAGDDGKKDDKKTQADDGKKPPKNDDDKGKKQPKPGDDDDKIKTKVPGDDTAKKPPKKEPIDQLVGSWKSDSTGRVLKAIRVGKEVELHVVTEADWEGAYSADEVRFKLVDDGDASDKTFSVIDRYRPGTGKLKYSKGALASCMLESTKVDNKTLEGHLKSDDVLEVTLAKVKVLFEPAPGDPSTIGGCKPPTTEGTTKSTFKREK